MLQFKYRKLLSGWREWIRANNEKIKIWTFFSFHFQLISCISEKKKRLLCFFSLNKFQFLLSTNRGHKRDPNNIVALSFVWLLNWSWRIFWRMEGNGQMKLCYFRSRVRGDWTCWMRICALDCLLLGKCGQQARQFLRRLVASDRGGVEGMIVVIIWGLNGALWRIHTKG